MAFSSDHITGFAVGLGAAALGFYLYKNNQRQVDEFLRSHGIDLPAGGSLDTENMTLEDLVAEKERLEDLIAEREYAASQGDGGEPKAPKSGAKKASAKKA
jgi:hypothetical protein